MFRGSERPSHVPLYDSSKCKKRRSEFLPRELDRREEQHAYRSHSLQLGFGRKYTFDMGRVGLQLSRLDCQPHSVFWAWANKMITLAARICCSILGLVVTSVVGHILGAVVFWVGRIQWLLVALPRRKGPNSLSLWDKGGYTFATHEQGDPFI